MLALERESATTESGVFPIAPARPRVAVAANKFETAWPRGPKWDPLVPRSSYEILDLEEALTRVYPSDAHLVTYVVDTIATHQPRLAKASLSAYPLEVWTNVLFCDVDNPHHMATSPEHLDAVPLETEGIYWTARGYRLVQPLEVPIPTRDVEAVLFAWLTRLIARGIAVDLQCRDWTRHFRLPHVLREGKPYRSPRVDLSRMVPIAIEPAEIPTKPRHVRAVRASAAPPTFATAAALPAEWSAAAATIAAHANVSAGERHRFSLALAGAALQAGMPEELVPAVVRAVAALTGASAPAHHEKNARHTIERARQGIAVAGFPALWGGWPGAAAALERLAAPPATTGASAVDLEAAIGDAGDGVTLIAAECGLGKTRAAIHVAAARAAKTHKSADAKGTRAPSGSKTAISVDKTELAIQVTADLRALGVDVARVFGPLSIEGEGGCRIREAARYVVAGGQSLQREFCEGRHKRAQRCEHYASCTARRGLEGPATARVLVGPHPMLGALGEAIGASGLLVVDEPPPLLATEGVTVHAIRYAHEQLGHYETAYGRAIAGVLEALLAWLETPETPPDLERLRAEVPRDALPPVKWSSMHRARRHVGTARAIGESSRTLRRVQRALLAPGGGLTVEGGRLYVTTPDEALLGALAREGATVVTDANADLHAALYGRAIGYAPRVRRFAAADGAPIERTLFRTRASRSAWLRGGDVPEAFYASVRRVLAWAEGASLGIVTFKALEASPRFAELIAGYPGGVVTAHYGAVRGLNRMADVDALATLGDPRPNLYSAAREAAYAGVEWEPRVEALARAELEQAHGRLRAVHRTRPAKACHVGRIWPGGSGWTPERVHVVDARGRVAGSADVEAGARDAAEARALLEALGSVRAVAQKIDVSESTVRRRLRWIAPDEP